MESTSSSHSGDQFSPSVENSKTTTVQFFGRAGEYFALWIVNLLLTIVTLGVYSAWAKVRNQRYFNANTDIGGHRFNYHAKPIQILKGRIIALILFIAFYFVSSISPAYALGLALLYIFAVPWLVCKSIKFNLQMTSYRNIRFNFHGSYGKALLVFMVYPILSLFTLYLALPLALKAIDKFICEHVSYGGKKFETHIEAGTYYLASLGAMLAASAIFIVCMPLMGFDMESLANPEAQMPMMTTAMLMVAYVLVFVVSGAIYNAVVRNHLYDNTEIPEIASLKSNVTIPSLIWLNLSNTW